MARKPTTAQLELIEVIHNLPPVKNLFFMCATKDQLSHYASEKRYWQLIALGLKAYFSGLSIKQSLRKQIGNNPPQFLILQIDVWLRFYDVINFGWDEITSYFDKSNLVMLCDFNGGYEPSIACPGDAVRYILESRSYYTALRQQTDKKQRWTYNYNYLTQLIDGLRRGLRLTLFDSFSISKG